MAEKERYRDPAQVRLYPLSALHSGLARPLSKGLAALRVHPNVVSLSSLAVSMAGLLLVASGAWASAGLGVALVYLGLVLDHADGQVARRLGKGSTGGMYLDMVIDRLVEIGLVLALVVRPVVGVPDGLPAVWRPLDGLAWLAVATVGSMMLWRFLNAYNDVLYLRSHLVATGRLPDPAAAPRRLLRRPLLPWVFNRDWVIAIWAVGTLFGQWQGTLIVLLALHVLACTEKVIVFARRHKDPEGDARRILGRDYH